MSQQEAQEYFDTLDVSQAQRFNLLISVALKLGKPIEGAYSYAYTIMTEQET